MNSPREPSACVASSSVAVAARATLVVDGGPDSGMTHPLRGHRQLVGRGRRADLRLDDPLLELHHGIFDASSTWHFVQLAGRTPWGLERDGHHRFGHQREPLRLGDVVTIGATRLRIAADRTPGEADAAVAGEHLPVVLGRRVADGCRVSTMATPFLAGAAADASALAPAVGAPVVVSLAHHRCLALAGAGGISVARALVRQLARAEGRPGLFIAAERPGEWEWATGIGDVTVVDARCDGVLDRIARWRGQTGNARAAVVITDDEQLVGEGSPARSAVVGNGSLVLVGAPSGLECGRAAGWAAVAEIGSRFVGVLRLTGTVVPTHFAGQRAGAPVSTCVPGSGCSHPHRGGQVWQHRPSDQTAG